MGAVVFLARSELRRRWRSVVVLTLLVGFIGAVVLALLGGARRTETSLARFEDRSRAATIEITAGEATRQQIETLRHVAGDWAAALIRREPDEVVARIVSGWPRAFEARRARDLGFNADESFEAIVRAHIEDEHGGRVPVAN